MRAKVIYSLPGRMVVLTLTGAFSLAGCPVSQTSTSDGGQMVQPTSSPPAEGQALYKFITETDPFSGWGHFRERPGIFDSTAPHGPKGRVWINDLVASNLDAVAGSLPSGSIIVKENLQEDGGDLATKAITVISKVEGFNPSGGDWFWAQFDSDGSVLAEGVIQPCLACHSAARDNDFIFLHQFGTP